MRATGPKGTARDGYPLLAGTGTGSGSSHAEPSAQLHGHVSHQSLASLINSAVNTALSLYASDGFGLPDYSLASSGAVIVHGDEWTSATWHPQAGMSSAGSLSSAGIDVPTSSDGNGKRTVNGSASGDSSVSALTGLGRLKSKHGHSVYAQTPYAILQGSQHQPGECWPMAGDKGRITVRLSEPVLPIAVTIEHAPIGTRPLRHDHHSRYHWHARSGTMDNDQQPDYSRGTSAWIPPASHTSAPRNVSVYGYINSQATATTPTMTAASPTFADGFVHAGAFAPHPNATRVFLGSFAYDAHGPAIQTFYLPEHVQRSLLACEGSLGVTNAHGDSVTQAGADNVERPSRVLDGPGMLNGDSATELPNREHAATGSGRCVPQVSFVTWEVESNHGHPLFTCVYRLRVHGVPLLPA